jgi:hypothetical protein
MGGAWQAASASAKTQIARAGFMGGP